MARIQPTSFVELPPATTTTTTTISAEEIAASGISPVEQTYTIQRGDSISRIATIHDITMEQLVNYNSWSDGLNHFLVVGDPVKIPPGAKIPGSGSASAAPTDDTGGDDSSSEDESTGDGCTHTIVQGENPSRVASKYDITVDELRAANPGRRDGLVPHRGDAPDPARTAAADVPAGQPRSGQRRFWRRRSPAAPSLRRSLSSHCRRQPLNSGPVSFGFVPDAARRVAVQ